MSSNKHIGKLPFENIFALRRETGVRGNASSWRGERFPSRLFVPEGMGPSVEWNGSFSFLATLPSSLAIIDLFGVEGTK